MAAAEVFRKRCPSPGWWVAFVTLTYRPGVAWQRRHVSDFLREVRRSLPLGVPFRYVWVMELTRAGVPHFHVAVWLPDGVKLGKPDEVGSWPHGSSRIERARAVVGYLLKYATKGDTAHALPRGAHLHGCGGLENDGRAIVRHAILPAYIRLRCAPGDHVVRFKSGGWVSLSTGEWWPSVVAHLVAGEITFTHPP